MQSAHRRPLIRFISLLLTLILIVPMLIAPASAATAVPYGSYYIDSYQTYVYPAGGGLIQVWFDITGVTYMDDIGALTIMIYESRDNANWYHVKTYLQEDYADMLVQNKIVYMSHVDYHGVAGRYYKAYVCFWAGKDGGGDRRYIWTSAKKAT